MGSDAQHLFKYELILWGVALDHIQINENWKF